MEVSGEFQPLAALPLGVQPSVSIEKEDREATQPVLTLWRRNRSPASAVNRTTISPFYSQWPIGSQVRPNRTYLRSVLRLFICAFAFEVDQ